MQHLSCGFDSASSAICFFLTFCSSSRWLDPVLNLWGHWSSSWIEPVRSLIPSFLVQPINLAQFFVLWFQLWSHQGFLREKINQKNINRVWQAGFSASAKFDFHFSMWAQQIWPGLERTKVSLCNIRHSDKYECNVSLLYLKLFSELIETSVLVNHLRSHYPQPKYFALTSPYKLCGCNQSAPFSP